MKNFRLISKIADRNLFSGDFVIPSQTLRIGSGLRLRALAQDSALFCHSDPERSEGEESPQETLRLRLRVTCKKMTWER